MDKSLNFTIQPIKNDKFSFIFSQFNENFSQKALKSRNGEERKKPSYPPKNAPFEGGRLKNPLFCTFVCCGREKVIHSFLRFLWTTPILSTFMVDKWGFWVYASVYNRIFLTKIYKRRQNAAREEKTVFHSDFWVWKTYPQRRLTDISKGNFDVECGVFQDVGCGGL